MTNWLSLFSVLLLFGPLASIEADTINSAPPGNLPPATPLESTTIPASTAAPAPSTATDAALDGQRPTTYTVLTGDTLWDLSHKFNCSVSSLKKMNNLKKNHLKPGQVLKIPAARAAKVKPMTSNVPKSSAKVAKLGANKTSAKADKAPLTDPLTLSLSSSAKSKSHRHNRANVAQPLQDFDIPSSNFASCPTPPSNGAESASSDEAVPPLEMIPPPGRLSLSPEVVPAPVPKTPAATPPVVTTSIPPTPRRTLARGGVTTASTTVSAAPPPKTLASALSDFFGGTHDQSSESGEWGNRFLSETHSLADHGIGYNQSWRPEGESHSWVMDCSNTTRYLYQVTAGIQLPRTASDQYYYLHLQNKAWDVPTVRTGFADCNFLRSNLKPGDLLFWENTYRPDRQPPITHVMIFLGSNAKGQWIMAGSQSSHGGAYNPHRSGPDVYVFDPTHSSGGYTTWMGLVHHQGRFCAYGRPLEADVKKLSVAAND